MSTKELITARELGLNLFDFVMLSSKNLLNADFASNKIKGINITRDELFDIEVVIVYMWLVFHVLNMKGKQYEDAATTMHTRFFNTFKIPESERDQMVGVLGERYEEYKGAFQKKKLNFQGVALEASMHCLKDVSKGTFFHLELGVRLSTSFKSLLEILEDFVVED